MKAVHQGVKFCKLDHQKSAFFVEEAKGHGGLLVDTVANSLSFAKYNFLFGT